MQSATNTFQGILITDDSVTYAVFIYECGGMGWGGGVIGWQAGPSQYASQSSSGESDNNYIGCEYSSTSSAIVYELSKYIMHVYNFGYIASFAQSSSTYMSAKMGESKCHT